MTEPGFLDRLPTHERRLDNGLTVIVREDHSAPVVAVVTHVKAGYFDEPDTLVGISHVLEHMYFKGTERRGPGQIARETKEAGGYLNAGTIYDRTSYYTVLPSSSLEQALEIQADALQRSTIEEDELRRELLVIIQEANRKLDNPGAVAREKLFETMFDVHRIRRWRIGTEAVLRGFTRDDVVTYYRNLYRASNTIVVIAGDVDPDHTFRLVEQHYGAMDAGEPVRDAGAPEPERRGFRYRELEGDIRQSRTEWGWRTPGPLHEDTPALDVLSIALGHGRASRLYRHVRDAGLVSSISAYNYTPGDVGVFEIGAELDPNDTPDALAAIAAVLRDVAAHGFTEKEVERARNILEARVLQRLETVDGQANMIAEWQALGDWRLAETYLEQALAVTTADLHDVARRRLDPELLTLLLYRPRTAAMYGKNADDVFRRLFGDDSARPKEAVPADTAVATHVHAPAKLAPVQVEDGIRFYTIDDGAAHIVIKPRRTTPLVSLALHCRGGVLSERPHDAGVTGLMSRTSVKGTRTRSGARLAEEVEALGGTILPGRSADTIEWSLHIPARHTARGLELLLDAALEPAFREEDVERERKLLLSDLEHLRDDMYQYPLRLAFAAAYEGHPYGWSPELLERSLRRIAPDVPAAWHEEHVLAGSPYVLAVGDIEDPDEIAGLIVAQLRDRVRTPRARHIEPPVWPDGRVRQVEERDKAQTALVLAFPGPPRNHPDVHALLVLSAAVSGLGGRLFEELRSRRSLAYAVSAAPMPRWLAGAFVAYIGTAPEREDEARDALLDELRATTRELLDPADVERAKRYLIGSWQIRQQTHARQLHELATALLLGEGVAELREYGARIEAVTAERVRAAAERWIRPDRVVEAVIRGTGAPR